MEQRSVRSLHLLRRILIGAAASTLALICVFAITLGTLGDSYYEWGIATSFAISWTVVLLGYCLGTTILCLLRWFLLKKDWSLEPNFAGYGAVQAVAMWISIDVPWVTRHLPAFVSSNMAWTGSVLFAVIVSVGVAHKHKIGDHR